MTWPKVNLETVAVRGSGHTPSQKHPEYWDGDISWVSLADSHALDRTEIRETARSISALGLRHSSAVLHPAGTVIVSRDAGVGKSAILAKPMAVSQHFIAWQCGVNLNNHFLYQWLQSHKEEFERIAVGSTVKTIGLPYFERLQIPLPPKLAQVKIATALGTWDSAIEKTERLIGERRRALEVFRRSLFRTDSPNNVMTHLAEVLSEHGFLSDGVSTVYSVSVHKGLIDQVEHLGRSFAAANTKNYNLVRPGDLAYTKSPTGDFPFGVVKQSLVATNVIVSPLYGVFTPLTTDLGLIVDFFFESPTNADNYLRPLVQKGAKNTISISNQGFLSGKIPLPVNTETAKKVADYVRSARKEISLLEDQVRMLCVQRKLLMKKLFSGKWQIPADNRDSL